MALAKMKLVNVIGMLRELDNVASVLGRTGVFQPDETADFFSDKEKLLPVNTANDYAPLLDKLRVLMAGSGIRPKIVDAPEYDSMSPAEMKRFIDETDTRLGELIERRDALRAELDLSEENIAKAKHFIGLDIDISKIYECEYIITRFGKLPKDSYVKLQNYSDNPYIDFFPCSNDGTYYWGVYVTPLSKADDVDRLFSRLFFEHVDISDLHDKPEVYVEQQIKLRDDLTEEIKKLNGEIDDYVKNHENGILKIFSTLCKHHAFLSIKNHACKYKKSFVLVGWIPAEYEGQIKDLLSPIESVEATFTKAEDEVKHSPPVKLKNRFFFKPFEYYTEMYGLPNAREIDPSWFIALTYTLLFGIMFADVGHGLMLLIAAIFMYKKMKMPLGALLIPCSISSMVFGCVFGSVFGFEHMLDPVYRSLFGFEEKPVEVMDGNTTMILIFGAVGIGIILLIIAMILNIVSNLKRGDIGGALFGVNGVAGLVFYTSLVAGLGSNMLFGVSIMNPAYIICLIVIPLLLVFFREPLSKLIRGKRELFEGSFGSFVVDNIFEMFEVALSYVTNTMSFLRVGAFILVHAGMMTVVFVLANMFGPVGYWITVVIGNILVMALEALLVGIQVLRLEYYEMFSRFYIGDGRKFEPVTVKDIA